MITISVCIELEMKQEKKWCFRIFLLLNTPIMMMFMVRRTKLENHWAGKKWRIIAPLVYSGLRGWKSREIPYTIIWSKGADHRRIFQGKRLWLEKCWMGIVWPGQKGFDTGCKGIREFSLITPDRGSTGVDITAPIPSILGPLELNIVPEFNKHVLHKLCTTEDHFSLQWRNY